MAIGSIISGAGQVASTLLQIKAAKDREERRKLAVEAALTMGREGREELRMALLDGGYLKSDDFDGYGLDDVFGKKPEVPAWQYDQLTPGEATQETLTGARANFDDARGIVSDTNEAITENSINRMETLIPGYMGDLNKNQSNARAMLGGYIPYTDALDATADRQGLGNALGTAGTYSQANMRDLGLSRMGAMQSGAGLLGQNAQIGQTIDPIGRHSTPDDWLLRPKETYGTQVQQNWNDYQGQYQNALQQAQVEAAPTPAAAGMFGMDYGWNQQEMGARLGAVDVSAPGKWDSLALLAPALAGAAQSGYAAWSQRPNATQQPLYNYDTGQQVPRAQPYRA